jgi:hypothetical protein
MTDICQITARLGAPALLRRYYQSIPHCYDVPRRMRLRQLRTPRLLSYDEVPGQ